MNDIRCLCSVSSSFVLCGCRFVDVLQPVLMAVTAVMMTFHVDGTEATKLSAQLALYPLETFVSVRSAIVSYRIVS